MAGRRSEDDPHRLVHVLSGTIAGIGIGLLTGFVALRATVDLLNKFVGPTYVGEGTAVISLAIAILLGLQVGLFCSRSIPGILRDAGTITSWLFLIALLMFTTFVAREAYIRGFLPKAFL